VSEQKHFGGFKVIGGNPNGRVNVAFIHVQGEKRRFLSRFESSICSNFFFGSSGPHFDQRSLGRTPKKISRQVVRRTLAVTGDEAEIPAKISRGLHQVARHPTSEGKLA
jgi:hypothetical protein